MKHVCSVSQGLKTTVQKNKNKIKKASGGRALAFVVVASVRGAEQKIVATYRKKNIAYSDGCEVCETWRRNCGCGTRSKEQVALGMD